MSDAQPPRRQNPEARPKHLQVVPIVPPPQSQRRDRSAVFAQPGERRTRYSLPTSLDSTSPVGYRTRVSLSRDEAQEAVRLLTIARPTAFEPDQPLITDQQLFEECSLGVMSSRQSTNFRGHEQVTFGPRDSQRIGHLLRSLMHREAPVLDHVQHTHVVLARPYRTPFTMLLTLVGHTPVASLLTVPVRAWRKRFEHIDDIPTIGYLKDLHVGILAEAIERGTVVASGGRRKANVFMAPFCGGGREDNKPILRALEDLCGLGVHKRSLGWRVALVAQVGTVAPHERPNVSAPVYRKMGANLLAFRSERIQPGVNAEEKAPKTYHERQDMDVPDELTVQAGRAAYNAFAHWTNAGREDAKELLLLDRIDVLAPGGKEQLRKLRKDLNDITDRVIERMPTWADLPVGRAFSRNANRGRKAFALVGQRIYITGLQRDELAGANVDWTLGVRAVGAAAARSALYAELMGVVEIPDGCDMLAGICLMAGPVNQNDIGKQYYGYDDILETAFPGRDPTSLLVWVLKAKTVADPIGNEEQLLNAKRKGALVDLRPGPHEVIKLRRGGRFVPFRKRAGKTSMERAFAEIGNFVTDPSGREIPGNRGAPWPKQWAEERLWSGADAGPSRERGDE